MKNFFAKWFKSNRQTTVPVARPLSPEEMKKEAKIFAEKYGKLIERLSQE